MSADSDMFTDILRIPNNNNNRSKIKNRVEVANYECMCVHMLWPNPSVFGLIRRPECVRIQWRVGEWTWHSVWPGHVVNSNWVIYIWPMSRWTVLGVKMVCLMCPSHVLNVIAFQGERDLSLSLNYVWPSLHHSEYYRHTHFTCLCL